MPPAFTLDADTVVHLHSLGLLSALGRACGSGAVRLHMTGIVRRIELNRLETQLVELEKMGLKVHAVTLSSPAGLLFRKWQKEGHWTPRNKGERETVAWMSTDATEPSIYVSHDSGARAFAHKQKLEAVDLLNMLCVLVQTSAIEYAVVARALTTWDDPHAGNGRPKGFTNFETAYSEFCRDNAPSR